MPLISASSRTLQIKIVYYGPGLSGKTTNLEQLSQQLESSRVGELMSLDTTGDRTLFFDWMPVDLGSIRGFAVKIQLFTVPGQVRYNNTRRKVLQGVDGVVFVADSQQEALDQNRFSFQNLRENLAAEGIDLEDIPLVIQWNKGDLPTALEPTELGTRLNLESYPQVSAVASEGRGVRETVRRITRLTLDHVRHQLTPDAEPSAAAEKVPMDGHDMLDRIMTAGVEEEGPEEEGPPEPDNTADVPDVEIDVERPESDDEVILGAEDSESLDLRLLDRVSGLEREVRNLKRALQEASSQLPVRVADVVEREVEPTTEKVADLESRLGIMQRVMTRLGGRVDVLERRVARLELQDRQPGRTAELKEMAGHVHDLSRLMAAFARRLNQGTKGSERISTPVPSGAERASTPVPSGSGAPTAEAARETAEPARKTADPARETAEPARETAEPPAKE
jgi:signal recognition particle receptor subunit beta